MNATSDAEGILLHREQKFNHYTSLCKDYNAPLIILGVNKPGVKKSTSARHLFDITYKEIRCLFHPLIHTEEHHSPYGDYSILLPKNNDAAFLKQRTMWYEDNSPHGRLIDLDVITSDGQPLQRTQKRPCFLCDNDPNTCRHANVHTLDELNDYFTALALQKTETFQETLSRHALQATLQELSTHPKPGLVDSLSRGAHKDMDHGTLLASIATMPRFFRSCAEIGFSRTDVLRRIRQQGLIAEQHMYEATGGINTHKGTIFTLGLAIAATAHHYYDYPTLQELCTTIAEYTKGITQELTTSMTHGAQVYEKYGVSGARGEVEEGLPHVRLAYPILKKTYDDTKDWNESMLITLLTIMTELPDTNILYRKDMETLQRVQDDARELLDMGVTTQKGMARLLSLDQDYSKQGISPGGSADLLSVTCYLYLTLEDSIFII